MKIKIPPYPNFKIIEEAIKSINKDSVENTKLEELSNHLVLIVPFKTGEKRIIHTRPVTFNDKTFITAFPNPIHLFLSLSSEHYNISEGIKSKNFVKCGKPYGKSLYLLDIEVNGTHECYNNYIKYRTSSIVMLVAALEAFLNHIIPNDFTYSAFKKNKSIKFTKKDIESTKVSFWEKMDKILPQCSEDNIDWIKLKKEHHIIKELYNSRKDLIHLKTNSQVDFDLYFEAIDRMLDLDILFAIESVVKIMNISKNDFIEIE